MDFYNRWMIILVWSWTQFVSTLLKIFHLCSSIASILLRTFLSVFIKETAYNFLLGWDFIWLGYECNAGITRNNLEYFLPFIFYEIIWGLLALVLWGSYRMWLFFSWEILNYCFYLTGYNQYFLTSSWLNFSTSHIFNFFPFCLYLLV